MEDFDNFYDIENVEINNCIVRLQKRYIRDAENPLEYYSDEEFRKRFRFKKVSVRDILLPIIAQDLEKPTMRGLPISPMMQLLIALRFYATNSFQIVHGDLRKYEVQSSVSRIIRRVSILFARYLDEYVNFPQRRNDLVENIRLFHNMIHFPNVSARYPGSTHDSRIYNRSAVRGRFYRNGIPGLLLGDNGYACSHKLLTPFLVPQNIHEINYNAAHNTTRNRVERLFGIWKRRFYCLYFTDIVMQDFEPKALQDLSISSFYVRYVDDIALAYDASHIDTLVNTFNSFHTRLKFTTEIGGDKLNFLDVKQTFSGRYLNYFSRHPLCQIVGLIYRVLSLSYPFYHHENSELIIKILLNSGYHRHLEWTADGNEIKNMLSNKFKQWNDQCNTPKDKTTDNNEDKINHRFFTIPFISFLSEKIKKFFLIDSLVRMAYRGINNLRGFIRGHKDVRPKLSHTYFVYKIDCRDCEASYVGQTDRCLKTRINEHRNHINWNTTQHSVITEHRISH
ncbi:Putative nuclease HARBI1 [Trachymyrmex cornetzi]|uniref:Putative nuclease HARBI1 n=1 Tax=Trachymyrmex cornetzi TaxID=471704 RepID=A0A195DWS7_9HYME|nr:Putative nuclease HARBI1 [Trachymyrmex cornetzi]